MKDMIFAISVTFSIYLIYNIISLTAGFYIYEKVKRVIVYTVYSYFKDINMEYVNLEILKKIIEKKFEKMNIKGKIKFIRIKWINKGNFKLDFKLNMKKNYPIYSYSFNINTIKETFKLEGKRGVDFE
jgi:hypothetical protein